VNLKKASDDSGFQLSREEKEELLRIARSSIEAVLERKGLPVVEVTSSSLEQKCGAFVTLEMASRLRGCIGSMESDEALYKTVSEMAVASAFRDPRFPPVGRDEFRRIRIEISVLSPLRRIAEPRAIEVGTHGILLRKGPYSGVLLPQVAARYGWTKEEFLRQTCMKAGLSTESWREPDCEIWIFSAVVFGEGEHAG
jgi:AmmeMemoRadiSam system protein A